MTEFYNPYHFVPISPEPGPGSVPLDPKREPGALPGHVRHDVFVSGDAAAPVYSGRLVCRLTLEGLLAVGSEQRSPKMKNDSPREVGLYWLGGKPALPGSALRGMIASLAEAASNSALRVLQDEPAFKPSRGRQGGKQDQGTPRDYFRGDLQESLSLQTDAGRRRLSVAEQLFGVVEAGPGGVALDQKQRCLTLAGRLRFSDALPSEDAPPRQLETDVTTPIMDSPKPPCPNFYFNPQNAPQGGFIPKLALDPGRHRPKGRKFYLHRRELQAHDWQTAAPRAQAHQKARVRPLKAGGQFWFTVDFDNLFTLEMQLLCYALRPSEHFRHKLGMGKPLGWGKVRLDPTGLFLVDRASRYRSDPLSGPRYHAVWRDAAVDGGRWPGWLPKENAGSTSTAREAPSPSELCDGYRRAVAQNPDWAFLVPILQAIELLGDPEGLSANAQVHYPQVPGKAPGTPAFEDQHFRWWQDNETAAGQYLRGLTAENTGEFKTIPALYREPAAAPPRPPARVSEPLPGVTPLAAKPAPKRVASAPPDIQWLGPVDCVFEKKEMGTNWLRFRVENRIGEMPSKGYLVSNADATRLPKPLREGTRVRLRYGFKGDEVIFDLPPAGSATI